MDIYNEDHREEIINSIIELAADSNLDYFDMEQPIEDLVALWNKLKNGNAANKDYVEKTPKNVPQIQPNNNNNNKEMGEKARERLINTIVKMSQHQKKKVDINYLKTLNSTLLEKQLKDLQDSMSGKVPNGVPEQEKKRKFIPIHDKYMDHDEYFPENGDIIGEIMELSAQLGEHIDNDFLESMDPQLLEEQLYILRARTRPQGLPNGRSGQPIVTKYPNTTFKPPTQIKLPMREPKNHHNEPHVKERLISSLVQDYGMMNIDELNEMDVPSLDRLCQEKARERIRPILNQMMFMPMMGRHGGYGGHGGHGINHNGNHDEVLPQNVLDESLRTEQKEKEQKELKKEIEHNALAQFADDTWIEKDKYATIFGCKKSMAHLRRINKKEAVDCSVCCSQNKTFYVAKCLHEMCKECWAGMVNAVPHKLQNKICEICGDNDLDNMHWLKICTNCKRSSCKTKWSLAKCPVCSTLVCS
jgi:hypothetical protein